MFPELRCASLRVESLPTFRTGKLQGAQDAVCPHMLRVGLEKHCIFTYVEQVSDDSKGPQPREILQVYEIIDTNTLESARLAHMHWWARHCEMPCAKRRAPSTVEGSTANVLQISRCCGAEHLRTNSCEFALEIAVGNGYHAEWQTQGAFLPARGRMCRLNLGRK